MLIGIFREVSMACQVGVGWYREQRIEIVDGRKSRREVMPLSCRMEEKIGRAMGGHGEREIQS